MFKWARNKNNCYKDPIHTLLPPTLQYTYFSKAVRRLSSLSFFSLLPRPINFIPPIDLKNCKAILCSTIKQLFQLFAASFARFELTY